MGRGSKGEEGGVKVRKEGGEEERGREEMEGRGWGDTRERKEGRIEAEREEQLMKRERLFKCELSGPKNPDGTS